jgi:ribose/xylose/arabinose/galactoside ABC-type transport system permease subunit
MSCHLPPFLANLGGIMTTKGLRLILMNDNDLYIAPSLFAML